ncbi:hypothetical protein GUJ93_ZPchr0007g6280 [Zizania palustris]|uniref:DUF1677 family protein n=1 Tax=Zizania palustris TaxID=103762 RepID=A0A8J5TC34_ZIZPA|nr:hypothetical protein GUJ93_ZPchr0007g6280 [Zizania palustris]
MYFTEIQWFVEIRKETCEDCTNNHSETKWSSSCHFDDSAELSEELKLLESRLEEASVLINEKDSRIVELDALNHKQPSKPVLCNGELLSLQSDMDRLFMEKMEAETQCFILTRASQAWKPLTEDHAALLDMEKSLPEDHKHLKAKCKTYYNSINQARLDCTLTKRSDLNYEHVRELPIPRRSPIQDARVIKRSVDGDRVRVLADDPVLLPATPPGAPPGVVAAEQQQQQDEARSVRCECCGMAEDCTPTYIRRVRERFSGRWVCGICAEAVSEMRRRDPALTVREAVASHAALCAEFNSTVRVNPALCLARRMRDIARLSCRSRSSDVSASSSAAPGAGGAKIGRTRSCALPYV